MDRNPRFTRENIINLNLLDDAFYGPAEIAEAIGVTADTVYRSYLPAGAPHLRDKSGSIRIHGPSFKSWVFSQAEKNKIESHYLKEVEIVKSADMVKFVDYENGRLLVILDLWGSKLNILLTLPRIVMEKIAAEVA